MAITDEQFLEARYSRREKAFDRAMDRLEIKEQRACALIGELMREGVTISYINILSKAGKLTGKIKEFPNKFDAIEYLVLNHYV